MTLWSCTQNNGEIDPWFGFWRLTSLTADGEPVEDYDNNIVWSFQNNIIMIDIYGDHEEYIESWGTWTCNDEETLMTLDFSHRDDTEIRANMLRRPSSDFRVKSPIRSRLRVCRHAKPS